MIMVVIIVVVNLKLCFNGHLHRVCQTKDVYNPVISVICSVIVNYSLNFLEKLQRSLPWSVFCNYN